MTDPNFDILNQSDPYYTPFTDDFPNFPDNPNPYLPADAPLIPQSSEKGKDAMDFGSTECIDIWELYKEYGLRHSPANPFGITGETSNQIQIETNLGNESLNNRNIPSVEDLALREPFSFPDCFESDPSKFSCRMSNQREINLGNENVNNQKLPSQEESSVVQEPFSFPSLVPPFPEFSWGMSNQRETNLRNENVNNQNLPSPEDSSVVREPFSFPSLVPPFTEERAEEAIDPLQKTNLSGGMCNESNPVNFQASCSKTSEETSNQGETNLGTQLLDNMNSSQLPVLPSARVLSDCSCCEILREIVHTRDQTVMKLQIHGRFAGAFYHSILDAKLSNEEAYHDVVDLYNKSFEDVKQFLTQYCIKRKLEGYTITNDPRSAFFQALCTGFDWEEILSPEPGNTQMDEAANSNRKKKPEFSLKAQRKRTKELIFKDLANYLHLTRKEAAEKLGVCETVVHDKWCSYFGPKARWPHRKIQSLEKEISQLKAILNSDDPNLRDRTRYEIRRKEEELSEYYKEPLHLKTSPQEEEEQVVD